MALNLQDVFGSRGLVYAAMTTEDTLTSAPIFGTVYSLGGTNSEISVNPNPSSAEAYSDNQIQNVTEMAGVKVDIDIMFRDLLPADRGRLFGETYNSGGGGTSLSKTTDISEYIAIGYIATMAGGAEKYFWLYKVKLLKHTLKLITKKDKVAFQTFTCKGIAFSLRNDNSWQNAIRTDDPNVAAGTITSWFTAPVMGVAPDLGALSCTISKGAAGHSGDVKFLFAKVGAGTFNLVQTLTAAVAPVVDASSLRAGTYSALPADSAGIIVYFTPTVAFSGVTVGVAVTPDIQDYFGVKCTTGGITLTWA